ncbi:MAG: response regulator [Anaerolineae bacterium]|nr:response regulator [Anaerolineae bacterium]
MSTWMVVEDEPDIYAVLLAMFEVWGIEGAAFVDGTEALAWVDDVDSGRVKGDLPELAIIDIRLPGASGPEVAARLRQSPILKHMTIVLITAYRLPPSEEDEVMAQADADLLLYKPLPRPEEFRHVLEDALARRADLAAQAALAVGAAEDEAVETLEDTVESEPFFLQDDKARELDQVTEPTEPVQLPPDHQPDDPKDYSQD